MAQKGPGQLVRSKSVQHASLHIRLDPRFHVYAYPILSLYLIWAYFYLFRFEDVLGSSSETATFALILVVTLHALSALVCAWSVSLKAAFTCRRTDDVRLAEAIKIIPAKHKGKGDLCSLQRIQIQHADGTTKQQIFFIFQKRKFIYNEELGVFEKLQYPSSKPRALSTFKQATGFRTENDVQDALQTYGPNSFEIPVPTFQELFKEHAVAPFFVFQVFCVALWFMDDMWYYSLFTLVMLVVFESTVVMQRLRNLKEFRSMNLTPYNALVYRQGKWTTVSTTDLLPGDIVSIVRPKDESLCIPADILLLQGHCIMNEAMLSGESTPLVKESIGLLEPKDEFNIELHRGSVVFGGTKVLQVSPYDFGAQEEEQEDAKLKPNRDTKHKTDALKSTRVPYPPDGGCIGYVLKTGFGTTQVAAASYVWVNSINNPDRKRSKVILDCILIVTSVVPPELPMELSLAVNNSLIALARKFIYVTEPFRIPFAGKIDVAAFDKTGTLTEVDLLVEGVVGAPVTEGVKELKDGVEKLEISPLMTTLTLAAAHGLMLIEKDSDNGTSANGTGNRVTSKRHEVVGDPMEKNTVDALKWSLKHGDLMVPQQTSSGISVKILRRFPFSSQLKRMSTISQVHLGSSSLDTIGSIHRKKFFVACKGAPETIQGMLSSVPSNYEQLFKEHARSGRRVLAVAYRWIDMKSDIADYVRDDVESQLIFGGFLVFRCPLKKDSTAAVRMLANSSHRCIMITGDNALTACHVAAEVFMINREALIADVRPGIGLSWQNAEETVTIPFSADEALPTEVEEYDLCVTGKALDALQHTPLFYKILPRIWVYARVSPSQKEYILTSLKQAGYTTLMCGDGTNDVGALKQAHVGIALLDGKPEDMDRIAESMKRKRMLQMLRQREEFERRFNMKLPPLPPDQQQMLDQITAEMKDRVPAIQPVERTNAPKTPQEKAKSQMEAAMQMFDAAMEDEEVPRIKFGDASVAAPFTSKLSTVMSVCHIVRQGRSTLVAMIQMYKILALNCLISAYSMSVLYLSGIKQGDWQATIAGLLITVCFFSVAKSTPLEKLSKQRPQSNIFNFYILLSVLGQAAVHVGALVYIRAEAIAASEELDEDIDLDAEFQPNLLNSAVYLVSLVMQIATFAINYQGHPFRESFTENKPLKNSIMTVGAIAFVAATELLPDLNEWMQLVPFPDDFRPKLLITMVLDLLLALIVEKSTKAMFSSVKPKASLFLDDESPRIIKRKKVL